MGAVEILEQQSSQKRRIEPDSPPFARLADEDRQAMRSYIPDSQTFTGEAEFQVRALSRAKARR